MNINQFIQEYRVVSNGWSLRPISKHGLKSTFPYITSCLTPHVMCQDGFTMSVQAGQNLYSNPKDVSDSYETVEVGYPSEDEPALEDYADGTGVFAYVPSSIVDEIIEKHGGIDTEFHNEVKTEAS